MKQKDGSYREAALRYRRANAVAVAATEDAAAPAPADDAPREVSLAWLEPLCGVWGPESDPDRVVHSYVATVGRQAIALREDHRRGAPETAELQGLLFGDPASGTVRFVAVAGHGEGQGRLFRGEYRQLDDGAIERVYTVDYKTLADTPGEELGGLQRRYREVYRITGDRLDATLDWWRDGRWQPFAVGKYTLVRR